MMKKTMHLTFTLLCACGMLAIPPAALAGDSAEEASTAADHAGYAAKATDINVAHMHLHHAVNCLVGPNAEHFDSSQANPCAAMGNGAIPDSSDKKATDRLVRALNTALAGLAADNIDVARDKARELQSELQRTAM